MTAPQTFPSQPAHDPAVEPARPEASLGQLFGELTEQMGDLFRQELELAKVEAKQEATRAGKGAGLLGAAGVLVWIAVVMLSFALAWLLDQAMNTALAFLIVGVLWIAVAAVLALKGRKILSSIKPLSETTTTLKEDVQWAKAQKS